MLFLFFLEVMSSYNCVISAFFEAHIMTQFPRQTRGSGVYFANIDEYEELNEKYNEFTKIYLIRQYVQEVHSNYLDFFPKKNIYNARNILTL